MSDHDIIDLLCQLNHATTLQQLCDLTYQITGNPVFISDMAHTILAYTKCVNVPDPTWQDNIVEANLDPNTLRQDREVSSVHSGSSRSQRPVLVKDEHLPFPRIIKTLSDNGSPIGVVVLTSYLRPFDEQSADLLDLVSSFVLPCLLKEHYYVSSDSKTIENFFIKLLEGSQFTNEQIAKRLEVLGYTQYPHTYVAALCSQDGSCGYNKTDLPKILADFSSLLHGRAFVYNAILVCVYTSDQSVSEWSTPNSPFAELLSRWNLIAGISRRITSMEQFRAHYLQARSILEIGRRLNRTYGCYPFDTLSSFLLFDRIPCEQLSDYCHQQICELWEYDQLHHADLCVTLQIYLEQAKSLARTADILYIHRNTVRYRVNRCMELLGSKLEDGNEIFSYILSLRILEYQNKIAHTYPSPREKES